MATEPDSLSGNAEDRFCARELVDRARSIRKALQRRREAEPGAARAETAAILSELDALARASRKLAAALRHPPEPRLPKKPVRAKKPTLVLVNPVKVPRRYSLENVLEKLSVNRTD